jgi:membrane protein required for beta-lactamase induction
MDSIPKPIVDALVAAAVALVAALAGVAIAALNAWRKRLEQDRAVQAAEVAVRAAEQLGGTGEEKKAVAVGLAGAATDAMIEAAVHGLRGGNADGAA